MSTSYIGIDLGTSNCAVALAGAVGTPEVRPIPQVVAAAGLGEKALLPSAVYLPAEGEFPEGLPSLPGENPHRDWFLGIHARERGALQPERLILSAKSWLCHHQVDRRAAILPWGSESVTRRWSPLEVSREILAHLTRHVPGIADRDTASAVVVTVPASFDETARALTLEAAREAGLGEVTLLEEPQAAFYAWLETQGASWRQEVRAGDILLVVDVGGGTTDFSLIAVNEVNGDLSLERVAVGEHLLLGGDNLDLALTHGLSEDLTAAGTPLDEWQFAALLQAVRGAKEQLLAENPPPEVPLAIPSRGSKLLGGTVRTTLARSAVESVAIEGFWPLTSANEMPQTRRPGGLREAGLPYAADPAISKHLARFLQRARENAAATPHLQALPGLAERLARGGLLLPDAVLFNGGFFHPRLLRERVLQLLAQWGGHPVRELPGAQPDHAVALGAAAYARLRTTGEGLRIKAGTARSYYIGMEATGLAVPGRTPKVKALCVAPQGMEEGSRQHISGQTFYLTTGEVAEFRFFHSEARGADTPGFLLPDAGVLEESTRLSVAIPPAEGHHPGEEVPVELESVVTELGNLELHLVSTQGSGRWKLEFGVRLE